MAGTVKMTIRLPVELKAAVEKAAHDEDRSATKWIERALVAALPKKRQR